MLSPQENKMITETGPGTPMGDLFRRYWLPVLLAEELPEPDCAPIRQMLLGEELVISRTTSGRISVLDLWCPHRNASLFWGRNEDEGIRCVYHGWKFDSDGNCVDMPSEPPESRYNDKVKLTAYQGAEHGGVIWVYMGPKALTPPLPDLEWALVPDDHRMVTKRIQECNYLQNVEGEVDSSHVSFLHSRLALGDLATLASIDKHPVFDVKETDYGLAISARRDVADDKYYWRITQFLMPSYTMIPAPPEGPISFTSAVPVDDTTMIGLTITWRSDRPLDKQDIDRITSWTGVHTEVDQHFMPVRNKQNSYLIDRADQKHNSFTGIRGVREQDLAVQEDQRGRISDRTREHLGTSDLGAIAMRRRLLKQAQELQAGVEPTEPHNARAYRVRSAAITEDKHIPWDKAASELLVATATG